MVIDLSRCFGCQTCTLACKSKNNLPKGMIWNRVLTIGGSHIDTAAGTFPNDIRMQHLPINCQHCDNPPCVSACPTGASYKRAEDGIVLVDADKCIGCRMCMVACPYNARTFNWKEPEYYVGYALGDIDAPTHQFNTVEKCDFCAHRLAKGEEPACMQLCPGRARYWGDLDDPNSDIRKVIQGRQTLSLLAEKGTEPAVIYLV
jgi:molybdopterin-containing oxidoreductase family iron-sulfur binding subunit